MQEEKAKTGWLQKINFAIGKLCRIGTRQMKLASIRRQRRRYLQNLGERLYVFKVLQQEEDVWDKEEISQLLLTLADLDQEQELLLQEISDIRAEDLDYETVEEASTAAPAPAAAEEPAAKPQDTAATGGAPAAAEKPEGEAKAAAKPQAKKSAAAAKKTTTKTAAKTTTKTAAKSTAKTAAKTGRKTTSKSKTAAKKPAAEPAETAEAAAKK
ncbi:MAG: hypothetical protein JRJ56_07740 [Deltaproteobacteria bacterium]|nr:hypothetical protein [Deltaproteobacteria bacterium]